jgi:hypothetical protein
MSRPLVKDFTKEALVRVKLDWWSSLNCNFYLGKHYERGVWKI